jgi:hypothetical protein
MHVSERHLIPDNSKDYIYVPPTAILSVAQKTKIFQLLDIVPFIV